MPLLPTRDPLRRQVGPPHRPGPAGRLVLAWMLIGVCHPAWSSDGLSSWNAGPAREAIVRFITDATTPGTPAYVDESRRHAVFLGEETFRPGAVPLDVAFARYQRALSSPAPTEREDPSTTALLHWSLDANAGLTPEAFEHSVHTWLNTTDPPSAGPFLPPPPIQELAALLRQHGFKVWLVSEGSAEVLRPWAARTLQVPDEQVIASTVRTRIEDRDGQPVLVRESVRHPEPHAPITAARLLDRLGRRPVLALARGSAHDSVLRWTHGGTNAALCVVLDPADADEAKPGWTHVRVDQDWNTAALPATAVTVSPEAAAPPVASTSSRALPDLSWTPPEDEFDWVQLNTGEWLKGRIKAVQDRELDFESEKLEDLTFDWKDIRQLRTGNPVHLLMTDGRTISGRVRITPDVVTVTGAHGTEHPRDQLQSLTPGDRRGRQLWSGSATVGVALRAGNTEQLDYTAQAHLQRRTPATRLSLDYIGNFSRVDGEENANNHRLNAEFDRWLSRRFYLVLPGVEYYRDPFQNLAHRVTAGVGVGYDLIDRSKVTWNITTGPAYQHAWFVSALPGEPTEKGAAALWFGSRFDWEVNRRIDFTAEYRGQYTSRKVGETTHHSVTTLSLELTDRFDFDVSFIWDRISQPSVSESGEEPQPDDFRLTLGVGLDF